MKIIKKTNDLLTYCFFYIAFFFFVFLSSVSCTRDDFIGGHSLSTQLPLVASGKLPVDMSRYNRRLLTKSSVMLSDTFSICIDSLVDFSQCKQVCFEDSKWIYDQFSFKSNVTGLYGALVKDHRKYLDSLVQIKCYYLEVSNIDSCKRSEYVVTMIPTKTYSEQNPDYDYLNKPSYSGLLLYSSKEGQLIQSEIVINGRIFHSSFSTADNNAQSKTPFPKLKSSGELCILCGVQPATETGFCSDCEASFLDAVVVIGIRDQNIVEDIWANFFKDNEPGMGYIGDPGQGGGGSFPSQNPETSATECCVSILVRGCYTTLVKERFTKGTPNYTIIANAQYTDSCWFKEWNLLNATGIKVDENTITIDTLNRDLTVVALYEYDNPCSQFNTIINVANLPEALKELIKKQDIQYYWSSSSKHEWATIWYSDTSSFRLYEGEPHKMKYSYQNRKLRFKLHLHPEEDVFLSGSDFGTMCSDFWRHALDPMSFLYGVATSSYFIVIKLRDSSIFNNFIRSRYVERLPNETDSLYYARQKDSYVQLYNLYYDKLNIVSVEGNPSRANKLKYILNEIGLDLSFGEAFLSDDNLSIVPINPNYSRKASYNCN